MNGRQADLYHSLRGSGLSLVLVTAAIYLPSIWLLLRENYRVISHEAVVSNKPRLQQTGSFKSDYRLLITEGGN